MFLNLIFCRSTPKPETELETETNLATETKPKFETNLLICYR